MTEQERVPVGELHFDRANPRLAEFGIDQNTSDEKIIEVLWDAMDVRELVQSIAASGFFSHEALIVTEEDGRKVVIEGNRRLAAVRLLRDPGFAKERGWELPEKIEPEIRQSLEQLPVSIESREAAWRFLGFKHVNGPAKWSSYAKAKYIADVHRKYQISLADIASQIGDRHRTVQRLYRGLMVIDQAEKAKVWNRDDKFRGRLAFSHLYTGLDYEGISSFIDLVQEDEESPSPVPENRLKELRELFVWLYGSRSEKIPPVVESQNPHLRQLDEVLKHPEALSALRAGRTLERALEISRPAQDVFADALIAAKQELLTVRAYLTEGYDASEALLRVAGTVADMAEDIYREMERKFNPSSRPERLSE